MKNSTNIREEEKNLPTTKSFKNIIMWLTWKFQSHCVIYFIYCQLTPVILFSSRFEISVVSHTYMMLMLVPIFYSKFIRDTSFGKSHSMISFCSFSFSFIFGVIARSIHSFTWLYYYYSNAITNEFHLFLISTDTLRMMRV